MVSQPDSAAAAHHALTTALNGLRAGTYAVALASMLLMAAIATKNTPMLVIGTAAGAAGAGTAILALAVLNEPRLTIGPAAILIIAAVGVATAVVLT